MRTILTRSLAPFLILLLLLVFASSRENSRDKFYKRTSFLLGTLVEVTLFDNLPGDKLEEATDEAFREIKRLEKLLGRRQVGSDIWRANNSKGAEVKLSTETLAVIEAGMHFNRVSSGAFDISLGRLMELWNFEGDRTEPPTEYEIKNNIPQKDRDVVKIEKTKGTILLEGEVKLDLGGIAKGYIIDRAAALLEKRGIKNFIINAGGDMRIKGKKGGSNWRIGLQHPRKKGEVFAHIDIEDEEASIVTSGDYERFFMYEGKRFHHILNPFTGYPAEGLASVTIMARDTMTADALCTTVFVLGKEEGLKLIESLDGVEGLIIEEGGKTAISSGIKEKVVIR